MLAEIGAIGGGAVEDVEFEAFALEKAGILGEQAEKDADEEPFEPVSGITAGFERVVKCSEDFHRPDIDRILFLEAVLLVAGNKGEGMDVAVEFGEWELRDGRTLILRFQIVQGDSFKVGNDDVSGDFPGAAFAGQILDVAECLRFGFPEIRSGTLMLNKNNTPPEQVDEAILSGDFPDGFLEAGDYPAADAEYVEELVPERLFFGGFALFAGPLAGEPDRVVADFVPGQCWHVRENAGSL